MKYITNSKDFIKAIKKSKQGECIIYDEATQIRNEYKISNGNLEVLKSIPEMMKDNKYRERLRRLVLEYKTDEILKHGKGKMFM